MATTTSTSQARLMGLLRQLFQFDRADLDFGIYRVMNQRRAEISRFLDSDLLPQVRAVLSTLKDDERERLERELAKAYETEASIGVPHGSSQRAKDLETKLAAGRGAVGQEDEVFSDLFTFFSRYYNEGDFISLRRYKPNVYAIPYEGEETKFYWANSDQFYVKTTETFQDYRFWLPDGRHAHFRLALAEPGRENNRAANGNDRRFILRSEHPVAEVNGDLELYFEFRPSPTKQAELNAAAISQILDDPAAASWRGALAVLAPTPSNPGRTILEKHLTDYTAKNTFDYFIHKNLGAFLRRELDFYLKNEVAHLDDLDTADETSAQQYLARLRAVKRIGLKIIDFLAQLEDFQRLLYLKRKVVLETNYCITLDKVIGVTDAEARAWLLKRIAANDAQREEWVRLFAIDEIEKDAASPGYSVPLTVDFLRANDNLLLDTRFFDREFTARLISALDGLDATLDGLLIHSDNFQALQLLGRRYRDGVKCIYIDPPYNTDSSAIPYKNNYRHSSWITMMYDRLAALQPLLPRDGAIFVSIDKNERTGLEHALDDVFGPQNRVEELIWAMNTTNSQAPNYSTNHEYVEVYAKDRRVAEADPTMFREPKPGYEEVMALVQELNPSYPSIADIEAKIRTLYARHVVEFREEIEAQGLEWKDQQGNDPWKGIYNYNHAEYRDASWSLVSETDAQERKATIWVWRESDASMPATKQAKSTQQLNHPNYRFYQPLHPVTGKPCPHPKSGWKFAYADDADSPDRRSFVSLDKDHRIAWGADESKVPQLKRYLNDVETNIGKSVFQDFSDGEKQTSAMFGRSGIFLAPKHANFVARFIRHAAKQDSVILDCFAGTGSTAHAVIDLNREDGGHRKYVLVEVGEYFDTVLKPRVLKAAYASAWKDGKPQSRRGGSHALKYLRLESYEDALMNVELKQPSVAQRTMLDTLPTVREDYLLHYMLPNEAAQSPSLLNLERFDDPFQYQLTTFQPGESRAVTVDLPETFNWLLGLTVERTRFVDGYQVVEGTDPEKQRVLVIWRNLRDARHSNEGLEQFCKAQGYLDRAGDEGIHRIYVNGDCTLSSARPDGATWQVFLIEEAFKRLMFTTAHEGSL